LLAGDFRFRAISTNDACWTAAWPRHGGCLALLKMNDADPVVIARDFSESADRRAPHFPAARTLQLCISSK
jgi:hypothetical protein